MDKLILTPDTSCVNRLADDADSAPLIAGLVAGFHLRLTFTSVSEVIATTLGERRQKLLGVCRMLLSSGDCIDPQHEIIKKMVARFESPTPFDWTSVDVRFPEAESEIAHEEDFTDNLATDEREESRANGKVFDGVYDGARPSFDKLFAAGTEKIPSTVAEFVARLQSQGAFWTLAGNLYARVATKPADDATMRRFVTECAPFRALMVALFVAQYDRCIREKNPGSSLRAGRNDTFMSVCLPYCNQFVTDDRGQYACYKEVVAVSGLNVTVRLYDEFRESFFILGRRTAPAEPNVRHELPLARKGTDSRSRTGGGGLSLSDADSNGPRNL